MKIHPKDIGLKFARKVRTKRSTPKSTEPEKSIQHKAEFYLDLKGAAYVRLPDSLMSAIFATPRISPRDKAFISGYLKGVADLTIFHPTKKIGPYPIVLSLEIKTESGKLTQGQINWQKKVGTIVAYGWPDTKEKIDCFLDIE